MTSETHADPPLRQGLEALLFLADEPLDLVTLAELLECDEAEVQTEVQHLAEEYETGERGMEIRRSSGGWRMYSADAARPVVERWALIGRSGRLTQAALETLAVIAYKQPISRQEVGDIRGVNADGAVRSLVARGFVEEVGRDDGAGHAVLYGTTTLFLERLGLDGLEELPPLTDYLPEAPAPDEPELGALKEIRRRLAQGGDLPSRRLGDRDEAGTLGGRDDRATNTGAIDDEEEDDDGGLPPPAAVRRGDDHGMDDLTDRLELAARSAADRLRRAVAAGEQAEREEEARHTREAAGPDGGEPDGGEPEPHGGGPTRPNPGDEAANEQAGGGAAAAERDDDGH